LERDLGVLAEVDVLVVSAEGFVVVRVIVAQNLAFLRVVVLESIEPFAWVVVVVGDGEHLDAAAGDGTVQFDRVNFIYLTNIYFMR
jgi:hypothetical protein